jgi:PiT family inorganic phosphate transporter
MDPIVIVVLVIALALFFDFTNGFHDTANAMATPIATGALKPRVAVAIAAVLNLVGALLSTQVAKTISVDLINPDVKLGTSMVFAGLTGAILWNLTTWILGLPSSSSHALFGGLIGAAIVGAGFDAVNFVKVVEKVIIPAFFAPLVAGIAAFLATRLAYLITARSAASKVNTGRGKFKVGQIFSSGLVALAHGTNDAQKTMGVITLVLVTAGLQADGGHVELWVVLSAAAAIAIGTYSGGWRIIRTMGKGLAEIKPAQGFAAETSTGVTILASSTLGFALSTTQVASGGVVGSGLGRRGGRVKWNKAGHVVIGWIFTLPAAAVVGALAALVVNAASWGIIVVAVLCAAAVIALFQVANRNKVSHANVNSEVEDASEVISSARARRKADEAAAKKAAKGGKK